MSDLQKIKIPRDARTLVEAIELSFKQFGAGVAIDTLQYKLTYAQLDRWSCAVAVELQTRFSAKDLQAKPIAILMSRSVEYYVAMTAVLRAGGFFLPIDPAQPGERIEFLLSDSEASVLLVSDRDLFEKPSAIETLSIDRVLSREDLLSPVGAADDSDVKLPSSDLTESDFAYMIYTSGSAGQPKGVPISHRSICNLCDWWAQRFELSSEDRTLQMFSLGFDASLEEIIPTLVTGGTLVPIELDTLGAISRFLDFVDRQQINVLHFPTAFWHTLASSLSSQETGGQVQLPASVKTVVFGGEEVDPNLVETWFSQVGSDVRLINAYGPTETTIAASYAILRPGESPSIGTPISGVSFYVVGEDGLLVEDGQQGELYIAGAGLATRYWRRDSLTAEKFVQCSFHEEGYCYRSGDLVRKRADGHFDFAGRSDDQIKLRGYRIEPGEVSNCLSSHPEVSQAHVMARQTSNTRQLVGYAVGKSDCQPQESVLKDFLSQQLPAYMVPARIILLDSFPVTPGGKLDLGNFPSPEVAGLGGGNVRTVGSSKGKQSKPFETPTEELTAKVWEQVLGIVDLGRDDNFFRIGGDSLLAMRLVLALESTFPGPTIPVSTLIPNPTIRLMAALIDQRRVEGVAGGNTNQPLFTRLGKSDGLISIVYVHAAGGGGMFYHHLHEALDSPAPTVVLESPLLYSDGPVVCEDRSVTQIARDYVECLLEAGCEKQLTLVGYSFGGLLAFEMTHLLKERGVTVDRIINIDSPNPQYKVKRSSGARLTKRLLLPATLSQRVTHFRAKLRRKWRIKQVRERQQAGLPPSQELRPLALELEFNRVADKYHPTPCDVPMVLIFGEYPEPMFFIPEDYGWGDKVSELKLIPVPGGHDTIFNEPYLDSLKAAFRQTLCQKQSS